jgi:hyperosmotically inducible periplasmic protein
MSSRVLQSSTLVLALAAAALLGACDRNVAPAPKVDTVPAATSVASDMAITANIKTRLAADARLSALAINVDTTAGQVVLRGTAPDTAARTQASELARAVEGVVGVDNALTVQATSK